jgi:hypothetical protein
MPRPHRCQGAGLGCDGHFPASHHVLGPALGQRERTVDQRRPWRLAQQPSKTPTWPLSVRPTVSLYDRRIRAPLQEAGPVQQPPMPIQGGGDPRHCVAATPL